MTTITAVEPNNLTNAEVRNSKTRSIGYDPITRQVEIDGLIERLEPRQAAVLAALIDSSGPVSRDELLERVWGHEGSDEALTQAVSKLRRALGDTSRPYTIIETAPKFGYRLGVGVREIQTSSSPKPDVLKHIPGWLSRNKQFIAGFGGGVAATLFVAALLVLTAPPASVERDIDCPAGWSAADCIDVISAVTKQ